MDFWIFAFKQSLLFIEMPLVYSLRICLYWVSRQSYWSCWNFYCFIQDSFIRSGRTQIKSVLSKKGSLLVFYTDKSSGKNVFRFPQIYLWPSTCAFRDLPPFSCSWSCLLSPYAMIKLTMKKFQPAYHYFNHPHGKRASYGVLSHHFRCNSYLSCLTTQLVGSNLRGKIIV